MIGWLVVAGVLQVYWGHISIVYAEMSCLQDLLRYKWKYFINLSGFMFPAHSNRELVEILRLYDGANDIEGSFTRFVYAETLQAYHFRSYLVDKVSVRTLPPVFHLASQDGGAK